MWNTNLFWCIVGLLGGVLTSMIFYFIGLKRKALTYEIITTTLISNSASQLEHLSIKYNDKTIENLFVSNIQIRNIGNCIIEKDDFAPLAPLAVTTTGEFMTDTKNGMKLNTYDEYNNVYPLFISSENGKCTHVSIAFDYISKKEAISCTIFHTGSLNFNGKLKEGKILDNNKSWKNNLNHITILTITSAILSVAVFVLSLL